MGSRNKVKIRLPRFIISPAASGPGKMENRFRVERIGGGTQLLSIVLQYIRRSILVHVAHAVHSELQHEATPKA